MPYKTAIITGASSGIGRATALRLAQKGIKMVLNGRNNGMLVGVQEQVNLIAGTVACHIVQGDITDKAVTDRCIAICREKWGRCPDIFIASAGRGLPGTVTTSDMSEWDSLIDTNVKGMMYQLRGIATAMLERMAQTDDFVADPSDIVIIGSSIGRNVSPFNSVYGATKFATHGLTEALRRELGPKGIRVSLIEPGLVGTNFQRSSGYDLDWFGNYAKEVGPILQPDDIAAIISFLIEQPGNVHMDNISIRPTRQAYP